MKTLSRWVKDLQNKSMKAGHVSTYFGRKRKLADLINSPRGKGFALRTITSHKVQGTAADIMKLSMVKIAHPRFGVIAKNSWQDKCRLIFAVHDELNFEVKEEYVDEIVPVLVDKMTFRLKEWQVPLEVAFKVGSGWDIK